MANLYKILHWKDVLICNHQTGTVKLNPGVEERDAEIEKDWRIITEHDLLHNVKIEGCTWPKPCTKVVKVVKGRAKDLVLKGEIPLLGNLEAETDGECGIVLWQGSTFGQMVTREGLKLEAYLDTAKPRQLTVGYGHNLTQNPVDGIKKGDTISLEKALSIFRNDLQRFEGNARDAMNAPSKTVKNPLTFDDLTQEQQTALTDLAFNMGSISGWPKFLDDMKRGDFAEARTELTRGVTPDTKSDYIQQAPEARSSKVLKELLGQLSGKEAFAEPE